MTQTMNNGLNERKQGGGRSGAVHLGAALAILGVAALVAGCGGGPSDGSGTGPDISSSRTGTGQGGVPLAVTSQTQGKQAGSAGLRESGGGVTVPPFNLSSTELEDMNLLSNTGEEIGEVEKVLVDENGQPVAITAEIGGFLGVGQKIVVIGLDRLQLKGDDEPDLATTLTKEELQGLQAWAGQ
jgi:PRC-barrel domain